MNRRSLKFTFLLKLSTALIVILAAIMVLFYSLFRNEYQDGIRSNGEALSYVIRDRAQRSLDLQPDGAGLEALSLELQRIVSSKEDVLHARILRGDGRIMAANVHEETGVRTSRVSSATTTWLERHEGALAVFTPIPGTEFFIQTVFDGAPLRQKVLRTVFLLIFVGGGALVIVFLLVSYSLRQNLEVPLEELGQDAARVAEGDLTLTFEQDNLQGAEIDRVTQAFASMTDGLRQIVSRIDAMSANVRRQTDTLRVENEALGKSIHEQNDSLQSSILSIEKIDRNTGEITGRVEELFILAQDTGSSMLQIGGAIEEVEQHVSQLSSGVAETSSSMLEISRSITEVAGRSKELARNADDMNTALQEISSTITQVEKNAKLSTDMSKEMSATAKDGLDSVEKCGESMRRIRTSVQETADVVQQLGLRSYEIGEIVTVINQVTEKTNLLALNAAIIAAAAGEHGASFAVVADGIRDLARQVAAKTREIEELVQGVQKETQKAEEKVTSGLGIVEEGETLSEGARVKLRQLYDTSLRSNDMAAQISAAMAEQKKNSQALAESSARVADISHQIAVATQQEASASDQIQRSITHMEELVQNVLKRTQEQTEGGRRVNDAIQQVSAAVHAISELAAAHKSESEAVLHSIQNNQSLLGANEQRLESLARSANGVASAVEELEGAVSKFNVG